MIPLVLAMSIVIIPAISQAGVVVRDSVTVQNKPVMLSARTSGTFLAKGGVLVEFLLDGSSLGKTLSGGDGIAYMEYTPGPLGNHVLTARAGKDADDGALLVSGAGDAVVFIDVMGALFKDPLGRDQQEGSLEAINELGGKFHFVYLYSVLPGLKITRSWLLREDFPRWPVLDIRGGRTVRRLEEMGLRVHALVLGPEMAKMVKAKDRKIYSLYKADRPDTPEIPGMPGKPDLPELPGTPGKSVKPGKPGKTIKPTHVSSWEELKEKLLEGK